MHIARRIVFFFALLLPFSALAEGGYTQSVVVTAYYSPLPAQQAYFTGDYASEIRFNGEGIRGADYTPVYAGMMAAPPSIPFGSIVELPGVGVFKVHDRGGRIIEWDDSIRLDIWMGHGDEGLARSLEWGLRRFDDAVIYLPGSHQPTVDFSLDRIAAPKVYLDDYRVDHVARYPMLGDTSQDVRLLQEQLLLLGYFDHAVTGEFGPVTQSSLEAFLSDYLVDAPSDRLTDVSAAWLKTVYAQRDLQYRLDGAVDANSPATRIENAKTLLQQLRYYHGEINGTYTDGLYDAILRFQLDHDVIPHDAAPGAGRIGPQTSAALAQAWHQWRSEKILSAVHGLLEQQQLHRELVSASEQIARHLTEGDKGEDVRTLQYILQQKGFFPADQAVTQYFGPLTKQAVIDYQIAEQLITDASHPAAGYVGPQTLESLQRKQLIAVQ